MPKPTIRYFVALVLIAAAVVGGFFVFDAHRRASSIERTEREVSSRIERMITSVVDFASAQQAYVVPGQAAQSWFERSALLLKQFGDNETALRPMLRSHDAAAALGDANTYFKSIVVIDGNAREYLQQGENVLAADLIFSEGRNGVELLVHTLRTLETSEEETAGAMRASLDRQQWQALAGISLIWTVGLVLLTPSTTPARGTAAPGNLGLSERASAAPRFEDSPSMQSPGVDLGALAEVCGALARTADANSLREALIGAAAVLEARGIVVWLGAGGELFPAVAYGYEDRVIARLGPIPRDAANATAAAWRSAQMRTVPADATSHGAIAVPLSSAGGCVGVFAAELRNGREQEASTHAAAAMIAAQLAAIVPAWPAQSASHPIAASGS